MLYVWLLVVLDVVMQVSPRLELQMWTNCRRLENRFCCSVLRERAKDTEFRSGGQRVCGCARTCGQLCGWDGGWALTDFPRARKWRTCCAGRPHHQLMRLLVCLCCYTSARNQMWWWSRAGSRAVQRCGMSRAGHMTGTVLWLGDVSRLPRLFFRFLEIPGEFLCLVFRHRDEYAEVTHYLIWPRWLSLFRKSNELFHFISFDNDAYAGLGVFSSKGGC